MEINWFTFGAQIVNFLILVALLKRFLYRPIINAMDDRERRIAARLEDAKQAQRKAEHQAEAFRRKTEQLEHQREGLLAQTAKEVESWKNEHVHKARESVEQSRAEWNAAIQRERDVLEDGAAAERTPNARARAAAASIVKQY